ncbi:MAG TPA: hypothetical protein VGG33_09325 [Polyangia bacterium]
MIRQLMIAILAVAFAGTGCGFDDVAARPAATPGAPAMSIPATTTGNGGAEPSLIPSAGADPEVVWRADSVGFLIEEIEGCPFCRYKNYLSRNPSAEQRAALQAMTLKRASNTCYQDAPSARVTILDADGRRRVFRWNEAEDSCSDGPVFLLTNGSFRGLEATVPNCERTPDVATNGCLISVPLAFPRGPFRLHVAANESRTSFLTECAAATPTLRLSDGTGQVLATGTPGTLGCSQIQHRFAAAGTYVVDWELTEGWAMLGAE